MFKRILIFIFCLIIGFWRTFAFDTDSLITLYVDSPVTWTSLYVVPDWYDLILNRIISSDINEEISLRDWSSWDPRVVISAKTEYVWWELVIKDEVQIISDPATAVDILVFWYLVLEGSDIQYYINWGIEEGINKPVLSKYFLTNYYIFKLSVSLILLIIVFLFRLMSTPNTVFGWFSSSKVFNSIFYNNSKIWKK